MEWLIWVIVIVLIVAIVWWLLSRNRAKSSSGGMAPSSPSQTASSPQMDATAAALTGSAPLVAATATAEQALSESRAAEPEPEPEPEPQPEPEPESAPEPDGVDVDDWERPVPPGDSGAAAMSEPATVGALAEEPPLEEPTLEEPVLSEEVPEEGVTADDVAAADAGPATPEQLADSAEWEATWSEGGAPAAPAPAHHREYTDAHAPTLPGAESAAAETADASPEGGQEDGQGAPDAEPAPVAAAGPEAAPSDGATPLGGHLAADQPYGEGSAAAGADGSGPDGYTVKGNPDTMIYHDEDSPSYDEVQAGVWFVSSAHAEAAGFRPPRRNRR